MQLYWLDDWAQPLLIRVNSPIALSEVTQPVDPLFLVNYFIHFYFCYVYSLLLAIHKNHICISMFLLFYEIIIWLNWFSKPAVFYTHPANCRTSPWVQVDCKSHFFQTFITTHKNSSHTMQSWSDLDFYTCFVAQTHARLRKCVCSSYFLGCLLLCLYLGCVPARLSVPQLQAQCFIRQTGRSSLGR